MSRTAHARKPKAKAKAVKCLHVLMPAEMHRRLKVLCARRSEGMNDVLLRLVEGYVGNNCTEDRR